METPMQAETEPYQTEKRPLAFISSFYCEMEGFDTYRESPLWQLRQDLAGLNGDSDYRKRLSLDESRLITWVAEQSEPELGEEKDKLRVVDRLVEIVRASDLYVCILGDHRRAVDKDHGSLIRVGGRETSVSYFEIEIYAAAMYGKEAFLYVLEGFDPGPRLRALLEILGWVIPSWRERPSQRSSAILREVKDLIRVRCIEPGKPATSSRSRLVEALYRKRDRVPSGSQGESGVLFLNGISEDRRLPDIDKIQALILEYKSVQHIQKRLSRLWLAVRELMPASYRPGDVKGNSVLREYLQYWDCVLGDWAGSASWHGWHGHLTAGTIAFLNSQVLVRTTSFKRRDGFDPEIVLPPDGALASAYYSVAGFLNTGLLRWKCLWRAGRYVRLAMSARSGPTDNLLAIRGSIRLALGYWPGAVSDFREMLRIRNAEGVCETKVADALMHLGFAYAAGPFGRKGRSLLRESVSIYEKYPDDPNLARSLRKLAWACRRAGQRSLAEEIEQQANLAAARIGADDQRNRERGNRRD